MANLTIRKLEPGIKERLRLRAARRGHSMEEEARRILSEACPPEPEAATAYARLRRYFVDYCSPGKRADFPVDENMATLSRRDGNAPQGHPGTLDPFINSGSW